MPHQQELLVLQAQAIGECVGILPLTVLFTSLVVWLSPPPFSPDTLGTLARTVGTEQFLPIAEESVQLAKVWSQWKQNVGVHNIPYFLEK